MKVPYVVEQTWAFTFGLSQWTTISNEYIELSIDRESFWSPEETGTQIAPGMVVCSAVCAYVGAYSDVAFSPTGSYDWILIDQRRGPSGVGNAAIVPRTLHAVWVRRMMTDMVIDDYPFEFRITARDSILDISGTVHYTFYEGYDGYEGSANGVVGDSTGVTQFYVSDVQGVNRFDPANIMILSHATRWSNSWDADPVWQDIYAYPDYDSGDLSRWGSCGYRIGNVNGQPFTDSDVNHRLDHYFKYYPDNFYQQTDYRAGTGVDSQGAWNVSEDGADVSTIGFTLSSTSIENSKYRFSFGTWYQELDYGYQPYGDLLTETTLPLGWTGHAYQVDIDPDNWSTLTKESIPLLQQVFCLYSAVYSGNRSDVDFYWPTGEGWLSYSKSRNRIPPIEDPDPVNLWVLQALGAFQWPSFNILSGMRVRTSFEVTSLTNWQFHYHLFFIPGVDQVIPLSIKQVVPTSHSLPATYGIRDTGAAIPEDALIIQSIRAGYKSDILPT